MTSLSSLVPPRADVASPASDTGLGEMMSWFALQSDQVRTNSTIVDNHALGQNFFLHIDKKVPPFFYPMMPRSAGDEEDNTCPRITVSPDLVACLVGYNRIFEDFSRGIDRDIEGHDDYEGGYVISKLPFDYALRINEKLVPESPCSREHWLVAYNESGREVHSQEVGKMFVVSISNHPTGEGGKVQMCVKIALEVSDPEGFLIAPNHPIPKGHSHYYLDLIWSDKNDPCSLLLDHISLTGIEPELYNGKKQLVAAMLSHQAPNPDGSLFHVSQFSTEQFQSHEGECRWMGVRGKDLRQHAWAATDERTAGLNAAIESFQALFPEAKGDVRDNVLEINLGKETKTSQRPEHLNSIFSLYLIQPTHGNHWWEHGNTKRMYEPEPGTLMRLQNFPGKEGVKQGQVFSLEQFLDKHGIELQFATEGVKPSLLFHGSAWEHQDLQSGHKRSGELRKWDLVESNKYLYATTDSEQALIQAFSGLVEKAGAENLSNPTYVERFEVDEHLIRVTYAGTKPNERDLMSRNLYLYHIRTKPNDGWRSRNNQHNEMVGEFRSNQDVPPEAIEKVQVLKARDALKDYRIEFVRVQGSQLDW